MIVDQQSVIPVPADRAWAFIADIPSISTCLPGVEEFAPAGEDAYAGALRVKVGPIAVRLQGRLRVVERDDEHRTSHLELQATERRINSTVNARVTLTLAPLPGDATELHVHTEASILGKLGEFGQAVMRRKADQIMAEFVANMARKISASTEGASGSGS